jgi:hypothetical protein
MLLELIAHHFAQEARIISGGIDQGSDSLDQSRWYWWQVGSILRQRNIWNKYNMPAYTIILHYQNVIIIQTPVYNLTSGLILHKYNI